MPHRSDQPVEAFFFDHRTPHDCPRQRREHRGLNVTTEHRWFKARPSGTEDINKIYAESFRSDEHLAKIVAEAKEIVVASLAS